MAWDPEATIAAAKCFACMTKAQAKAVQTYSLAVIAGVSPDPASLMSASACMRCIPPAMYSAAQAALLSASSEVGLDIDAVLANAACASCIPAAMTEQIIAYQYASQAGLTLDPGALIEASKCLIGLANIQHEAIQTYLLCIQIEGTDCSSGSLPEPVMQFMVRLFYAPVPPVYVVATLIGGEVVEIFDSTLCQVNDITNGGGDTFDCYNVKDYTSTAFPDAGVGFSSVILTNDQLLYYDFFSYSDGSKTTGTLTGGVGWSGGWLFS